MIQSVATRKTRVLIACPLHNGTCDAFRRAYANLQRTPFPEYEMRWYEFGGGGITVARNHMASMAVREEYDLLIFVAGDIGFPGDDAAPAIRRAIAHYERGEHVVGGLYLFKRHPLQLVLVQDEAREPDDFGLIEVEKTGTDFLAISVEAMRGVIDDWDEIALRVYQANIPLCFPSEYGKQWNLFGQAVVYNGEYRLEFLPEDFYWCRLAREAGFKVKVDTQIRLQHWGPFNYDASTVTGIDEAVRVPNPKAEVAR